MKIADLIATLQNIQSENGNIDVHFTLIDEDDCPNGDQIAEYVELETIERASLNEDGSVKREIVHYARIG